MGRFYIWSNPNVKAKKTKPKQNENEKEKVMCFDVAKTD